MRNVPHPNGAVTPKSTATKYTNGYASEYDDAADVTAEDYARVLFGKLRSEHAVDPDATRGGRPISEVFAAASFYLAVLGGPPKRKLIDALIAAAANRFGRFEYSYDDLLPLIWPESPTATDALKKQLSRDVKTVMEWQSSRHVKIFDYTEGGRVRDQNTGKFTYHPTEWEVSLLRRLHGIMDRAELEPDYDPDDNQMAALRRVAAAAAREDLEKGESGHRRTRSHRPRPGFVQNMKSAVAYVRKCMSGKSDPVTAGVAVATETVDAVCQDTGLTLDELFSEIRKLKNLQVVDSVESSPGGIFSPTAAKTGVQNGTHGRPEAGVSSHFGGEKNIKNTPKVGGWVSDTMNHQGERGSFSGSSPSVIHTTETDTPKVDPDNDPPPLPPPPDDDWEDPDVVVEPDPEDYQARLENNFPTPAEAAEWAREGFESMGCGVPLEVFYLTDDAPKPKPVEPLVVPRTLRAGFAKWVPEAYQTGRSLVLRMTGSGPGRQRPIIQVDDCNDADVERLRPFAFLIYRTSPGSYHVWLGIDCPVDRLTAIRDRLLTQLGKTSRANGGGYGSCRWPGSTNFKPEYRQPDGTFPMVEPVYRRLRHWVTESELESHALLALAPAPVELAAEFPTELPDGSPGKTPRWRPDYDHELAKRGGNRSDTDAAIAAIELCVGWTPAAVKRHLAEVSKKAPGRKSKYIEDTVDNAVKFVNSTRRKLKKNGD
jgi:hypothetical protein